MSGSSNALLDALANPRQVDVVGAYGNANRLAQGIWANRLAQSQQAAGEIYQRSLNSDGTQNQAAFNQGIAAGGPGVALSALDASQKGLTNATGEYDQQMKRLTYGAAGFGQILVDNNGTAPYEAVKQYYDRAVQDRHITQADEEKVMAGFGPDAAANASIGRQRMMQNITAQEALARANGTQGTVTGPNGVQMGTNQNSQTGAISSPPQPGAPQGPDAGTLLSTSTITGPDGSSNTDTLAGHLKAGRVTGMGALNPGFSEATASPAMVTALRGQEGTPGGQTSVNGARGQMQITPGFFKQYAQPGESFDSKADVETVAKRGIAALEAQYPNDPGRVATAYFSGVGNVAPAGSATPYKTDVKDGNGTATSAYVAGVTGRYKGSAAPAGGPRTGGTTVAPTLVKTQQASAEQYIADSRAAGGYQDRVYPLQQAAKALETAKTGEGSEALQSIASRIQTLTPDALKNIIPNIRTPDEIAAYDEARKYLTMAQQNRPGADRSDAGLATAGASSPSTHISPAAAKLLVQAQLGVERSKQAQLLEFNATHPQGTEGDYSRWLADRSAKVDPRAFITDSQSVPERKSYYERLGKDEKTNYLESYALAKRHGLLTLPNGQ